MNLPSIALWGFAATLVLTALMSASQQFDAGVAADEASTAGYQDSHAGSPFPW